MDDTAHATEEAHGAQNYDDDQEPFLDATDLAMQAAVELRHCVVRGSRRNGSEVEKALLECSAYGMTESVA